jgi:hypothetical protein
MNATFQTIAALIVVAATIVWFVARALARRKNPGCGGGCGCESADLKAKIKP